MYHDFQVKIKEEWIGRLENSSFWSLVYAETTMYEVFFLMFQGFCKDNRTNEN